MENLACCVIQASFSQERMTYLPEESKVIYESKDGKREKVFEALNQMPSVSTFTSLEFHVVLEPEDCWLKS
jgi:hypothetical protein